MGTHRHEDLTRVVDLARKVLADLDRDQIPGRLRSIVAQTRPALVLPLKRRLINEIDVNEWLRSRIADEFDGEVDEEDPLERSAYLFLHRPEGWQDDLREVSRRSQLDEQADRIAQMANCINDLKTELEDWRNQAKRNRKLANEAAAEAEANRRVAAARTEALRRQDEGSIKALRDNRVLRGDLEASRVESRELRGRLDEARAELQRERRVRRPPDHVAAPSAWASLGLIDSARFLDEMVESFSPESYFSETTTSIEEPLDLPSGVSPDDRSAIEWLLTIERHFVLLVDGYNAGFHLDNSRFSSPDIRRRLENDLARFKNLAQGRPRVVLVYDSDQTGMTTRDPGPSGIEIRFTCTGHTADDEILALAADLGTAAVVISSDRQVREDAQESGSLGLWSESMAEWIRNS